MTGLCSVVFPRVCRFSRAIRDRATTRLLLASFVLWLSALILIYGRPFGIAELTAITGGPTILDMTFTTTPAQVYAVLDALGSAGRAFDLTRIVPLDLLFPSTYALFLAVTISWVMKRWLPPESPWFCLNIAPVLAAAADYGENAGIVAMLLAYPAHLDPVAVVTSTMYMVKSAFSAISFIALFAALAGWAITAFRPERGKRVPGP